MRVKVLPICSTIIFFLFAFAALQAQEEYPEFSNETMISLKVSGINSIGDFKEAWVSGNGIYISYGNIYSDNWSLLFKGGFIEFKENSQYGYTENPLLFMIPLQIGGRYYFQFKGFRPFLTAMNGINIVWHKFTALRQDEHLSIVIVDEIVVKYNFQVGGGLGIKVSNHLELEGFFMYNSHLLEPSVPYNITGIEYGLGINWIFNQ